MNVSNIIAYCKNHGVELTEDDFYFCERIRMESNKKDGLHFTKWKLPIKQPTLQDLQEIDPESIKAVEKKLKKDRLKENELFPILEKLCEKINVNIDELL